MSRARTAEWLARGFVVVLAAYETFEQCWPRFVRDDWHAGDMSQHVWWTARFGDPGLFPDDFIADFFSLPLFAPIGYQALYRIGVPHLDPQRVGELFPFVLCPLLVWLCWRAGRAAAGGALAGAFVGGCLGVRIMAYIDPGLPRGFALPLLVMAMVGLLERRLWVLGLAGLGAALFYPPISVNLGLTAALVLGVEAVRRRRLPEGWPALAAFGALAAAIVLSVYAAPLPEDVGPKVTAEQARAMPEFHRGGRSRFFTGNPVTTFFGEGRGGYGLKVHQTAALAAVVAISTRLVPGAVPFPVWALLGTAVFAHALAHAVLFALHLPARYMMYSVPVFVVLWLSALAGPVAARIAARLPWLGHPALLAAVGVFFLARNGPDSVEHALKRAHRDVYVDKERTLAFLATLPKDALVAGHPSDVNSVPLRSKRSVLASKEVALPYYLGYYGRLKERLAASLRAIYADDWADVERLYEAYGVDVLAVYRGRLQRENRGFSEPFRTELAEIFAREPEDFVLREPPPDRVLFRHGAWSVVRLGPPRPGYERAEEARSPTTKRPAAAGTR